MNPKHKALLFNFLSFAAVFLAVRFLLPLLVAQKDDSSTLLVFVAGFCAIIISPKFFVMKVDGKYRVMMKILFVRQPKQVG